MNVPAGPRAGSQFLLTTGVHIERPIEAVFAVVADPRSHQRWWPRVRSCTRTRGEACEVGARYTIVHRPFALAPPVSFQAEVIARVPPDSVWLREESGATSIDVHYELEVIGSGTRLVRVDRVDWKLPPRLRPAAARYITRRREERLRVLKFFLERIHETGAAAQHRRPRAVSG